MCSRVRRYEYEFTKAALSRTGKHEENNIYCIKREPISFNKNGDYRFDERRFGRLTVGWTFTVPHYIICLLLPLFYSYP